MKWPALVLALVAIAALGAVAVLAGGDPRGASGLPFARLDRAATRAQSVLGTVLPAPPRPAAPEVAGAAVPVVDPASTPLPAHSPPPSSLAPAVVVSPPATPPTPAIARAFSYPVDLAPGPMPATIGPGWGARPAPDLDPRPFSEAHWQGLEAIPRTQPLIESLRLPPSVEGVVLDDVTLPADLEGFRAGDLVTAVDGVPTADLLSFIQAADRVREQKRVAIDIVRAGAAGRIELVALFERLGTANGETPAMIPPGARSPHPYQGPCLGCHRIGTTGALATDQGDPLPGPPPPIRATSAPPHRDRGPCTSCHRLLP